MNALAAAALTLVLALERVDAALSEADQTVLRQLATDYAQWDFNGTPPDFWQNFDLESFREQRVLLIQLAELDWQGFWGTYWRKRDIGSVEAVRSLSETDFWARFHGGAEPYRSVAHRKRSLPVDVDVHLVTEARGFAYVVFQATYQGRLLPDEASLTVLRARKVEGAWRIVAFPEVTEKFRLQIIRLKQKPAATPTPKP